jgi:hypothetical protein
MAKKLRLTQDTGALSRTLLDSDHVIVMDYDYYCSCILDQPISSELRQWVEHNLDMMTVILGEQFSDRADIDKYYLDIKIIAGLKPRREQR